MAAAPRAERGCPQHFPAYRGRPKGEVKGSGHPFTSGPPQATQDVAEEKRHVHGECSHPERGVELLESAETGGDGDHSLGRAAAQVPSLGTTRLEGVPASRGSCWPVATSLCLGPRQTGPGGDVNTSCFPSSRQDQGSLGKRQAPNVFSGPVGTGDPQSFRKQGPDVGPPGTSSWAGGPGLPLLGRGSIPWHSCMACGDPQGLWDGEAEGRGLGIQWHLQGEGGVKPQQEARGHLCGHNLQTCPPRN